MELIGQQFDAPPITALEPTAAPPCRYHVSSVRATAIEMWLLRPRVGRLGAGPNQRH
jgi:hypothetical protein